MGELEMIRPNVSVISAVYLPSGIAVKAGIAGHSEGPVAGLAAVTQPTVAAVPARETSELMQYIVCKYTCIRI